MLCALIFFTWFAGTNYLMSTLNDRFLRNFFMVILFYSQSFCQKSVESKWLKKLFFISRFIVNLRFTRNLLDYGDQQESAERKLQKKYSIRILASYLNHINTILNFKLPSVTLYDSASAKYLFLFGKCFKKKLLNICSNFFFIWKYNPSG